MAHVLFPGGVRLSTWIVLLVFLALGVRDRRYWWAGAAWIVGFEATFQLSQTITVIRHGGFHPHAWWQPVFVFGLLACGYVFVFYAARYARTSLPILGAALALWGIWLLTGFHVNGHSMVGFDPTAEALNEGAKTLWALAYLVPLLRVSDRVELD